MSPTNSEFSRVDLGPTKASDQGTAGHPFGETYTRVNTANASDPSENLASSTFRPNQRPEDLLDFQAAEVQRAIDEHLGLNEAFGLNQPIAGLGIHAENRDSREYGNVPPDGESGVPFKK